MYATHIQRPHIRIEIPQFYYYRFLFRYPVFFSLATACGRQWILILAHTIIAHANTAHTHESSRISFFSFISYNIHKYMKHGFLYLSTTWLLNNIIIIFVPFPIHVVCRLCMLYKWILIIALYDMVVAVLWIRLHIR